MYLKYSQPEKLMEKTLKKDDKFGGKAESQVEERRKFGGKMHKNASNN